MKLKMTESIRVRKYKKDVYKSNKSVPCNYCRSELDRNKATVDHYVPYSYAKDMENNYVISCLDCNSKLGRFFSLCIDLIKSGFKEKAKREVEKLRKELICLTSDKHLHILMFCSFEKVRVNK